MTSDPFLLLDVAPRFDLDLNELDKRHRDLMRTLHPDRFVHLPTAQRTAALSKAMAVNEAVRVLHDPLKRAEALLARAGIDPSNESQCTTDPQWLMYVMDMREELVSVRNNRDMEALKQLVQSMTDMQSRLLSQLEQAFAGDPSQGLQPLEKLRFVKRFLEQASAVEDELL